MGKAGVAWGIAMLLLSVLYGCGGSSGDGGTGTEPERIYPWVQGPSREFLIPDGDNAVQTFGPEASAADREAASRVIHAWMRARVAEDWGADCSFFSEPYIRALVKDANTVSNGKVTNCPQALDYFGEQASGTSGNTLMGPIDSLLVRGNRAFAQWHGPEEDWILPLRKEGGQWKVDIASPLERTE
jgi:hypothetical protein